MADRGRFYILDGHEIVPATMMEWGRWFGSANRIVASTEVAPGVIVSTVFLGMDHGWGQEPPQLFETMVFNDYGGDDQWRYSTWAQAEAGHMDVVDQVEAKLKTREGADGP